MRWRTDGIGAILLQLYGVEYKYIYTFKWVCVSGVPCTRTDEGEKEEEEHVYTLVCGEAERKINVDCEMGIGVEPMVGV